MDFPKVLTGLLSAAILVGCGSDSDESAPLGGAEYRGSTDAATITIDSEENLQMHADSVVKAISFVRYEENLSDYERNKHDAPLSLSEELGDMLNEASTLIYSEMVEESFTGLPLPADCGGSASASGNYTNFSATLSEYCVTPSASSSLVLNGGVDFQLNNNDYVINFDNVSFEFAVNQAVVQTAFINGSLKYSEIENQSIAQVNAYVKVDEVSSSAKITETYSIGSGNCQVDADFLAGNGVVYRIEDLVASLNTNSGYTGWGTLFIPDYGSMSIYYYNIQYCEDGSIGSGGIILSETEANPAVEFTYGDCNVVTANFEENGIPM